MEYRILGALEVLDGDTPVTPTAPKILSTLAMLLISRNTTVSREAMVDEIWPENPPVSAIMTLNTYVYHLRRLLGVRPSNETDMLITRPGGYEMVIAEESLDLAQFEATVSAGRRAFDAGRLEEASCELRRALALRRGPTFAALDKGPVLSGVAVRIAEDALDAQGLRMKIDMQLGRHRELIGELRALIAQNPLNEDLYYMLMLALYRSDRRLDSLETYIVLRRSLQQQYGVDPSPRLQKLHQAVLADAPSLHSFGTELRVVA
jgi:DNA-binding SARP family transcriptional activator